MRTSTQTSEERLPPGQCPFGQSWSHAATAEDRSRCFPQQVRLKVTSQKLRTQNEGNDSLVLAQERNISLTIIWVMRVCTVCRLHILKDMLLEDSTLLAMIGMQ